ncbi:uncharacterized protein B0H64DRAFT_80490 [Chaetomium fimeti]|uniref:Uncharacterized protein n=1 Tax=Chaetomium fimeti TaxID=1854472 RepID=A0AAE0HM08_9PEZI|nr:hypothetical protein B0H64DRAFT_80490 [Chaetomium fimeti]
MYLYVFCLPPCLALSPFPGLVKPSNHDMTTADRNAAWSINDVYAEDVNFSPLIRRRGIYLLPCHPAQSKRRPEISRFCCYPITSARENRPW